MRTPLLITAVICSTALLPAAGTSGATRRSAHLAQDVGSCSELGALGKYDVFAAGDIDAFNNQLQGGAAAGGDVTLQSYGIGVGLPVDAGRLDVIAGGNLTVSNARANGSVLFGETLSGTITVAPGGSASQGAPPFTFSDEVERMRLLSATAAALQPTGSVTLEPNEILRLRGDEAGRNVFDVTAALLQSARSIVIDVPPGASALVNVTGDSYSTGVAGTYGAGNGAASTVWNFTEATSVQIGPGLEWWGSVLAPAASVSSSNAQIHGFVWAHDLRGSGTILNAGTGICLPPPPPMTISLSAICIDPVTDTLELRLRNASDHPRRVTWTDQDSAQSGSFDVPASSDWYFGVAEGSRSHAIVVLAEGVRAVAEGMTRRCRSTIRVHKTVSGDGAAPSGTWRVTVQGDSGYARSAEIDAAETLGFEAPGTYRPGAVPIGQQPDGYHYTLLEPDPRGAVAMVDPDVVVVTDDQEPEVLLDNRYDATSTPPGESPPGESTPGESPPMPSAPPLEPAPPSEPLPSPTPLAPAEAFAPLLVARPGEAGADLAIVERFSRSRVPLHGDFTATVRIRNDGNAPAIATFARELPQADPQHPNRIVRITQIAGPARCTSVRPIICALGTLTPSQEVVLRAHVQALTVGSLTSLVRVYSSTPELNTTNNAGTAGIVVTVPRSALSVRVRAPADVPVGVPFSYRVRASIGAQAGSVRVCHRPPSDLDVVGAPGTFRVGGEICRSAKSVSAHGSVGFVVHAIPLAHAAGRTLDLSATASASSGLDALGHDTVSVFDDGFVGS